MTVRIGQLSAAQLRKARKSEPFQLSAKQMHDVFGDIFLEINNPDLACRYFRAMKANRGLRMVANQYTLNEEDEEEREEREGGRFNLGRAIRRGARKAVGSVRKQANRGAAAAQREAKRAVYQAGDEIKDRARKEVYRAGDEIKDRARKEVYRAGDELKQAGKDVLKSHVTGAIQGVIPAAAGMAVTGATGNPVYGAMAGQAAGKYIADPLARRAGRKIDGLGLVKGSQAAKDHMARLRAMRGGKRAKSAPVQGGAVHVPKGKRAAEPIGGGPFARLDPEDEVGGGSFMPAGSRRGGSFMPR